MEPPRLDFPDTGTFLLHNAFVPDSCLHQLRQHEEDDEDEDEGEGEQGGSLGGGGRGREEGHQASTPSPLLRSASSYPDLDSLMHVDIEVVEGVVRGICRARPRGGVGDNRGDDDGFSTTTTTTTMPSSRRPNRRRGLRDRVPVLRRPPHAHRYVTARQIALW